MKVLGVIIGYVIYALGALIFFRLTGIEPHAETTVMPAVATAVYGVALSVLAGWVAAFTGRVTTPVPGCFLGGLIALLAAVSAFMTPGAHWTNWLSVLLFAPSAVGGVLLYLRRKRSAGN